MENKDLAAKITDALSCMSRALRDVKYGSVVVKAGGAFGDATNDTEIKADRFIGEMVIKHLAEGAFSIDRITVEGFPEDVVAGKGNLHAFVDPLDGSLNYKNSKRSSSFGLPYTSCITVVEDGGNDMRFKDILGAGVVNPRGYDQAADQLVVIRENGGYVAGDKWAQGVLRTETETKLDLGSQIVIGEMYYPPNREMLARAFAGKKGWLRNPGSAAFEMALVAVGQAVAYVCETQKQHELGMGYALVKAAGGVAVDFDGVDLGNRIYDFKTQTPVVLAANQQIAEQILELIHKAKQ